MTQNPYARPSLCDAAFDKLVRSAPPAKPPAQRTSRLTVQAGIFVRERAKEIVLSTAWRHGLKCDVSNIGSTMCFEATGPGDVAERWANEVLAALRDAGGRL